MYCSRPKDIKTRKCNELLKLAQDAIAADTYIDTPYLDSLLLMAYACECTKEYIVLNAHRMTLTQRQTEIFNQLLIRRLLYEPMAYILGKKEFWGMEFKVNNSTLIPRPDTETVISTLLKYRKDAEKPYKILDLGTGSGCLLITALSIYKNAIGIGIDLNPKALDIATQNASNLLEKPKRAEFLLSNWYENVNQFSKQFDIILGNPPYIPDEDIDDLGMEVLEYEPQIALKGGLKGLEHYKIIMESLDKYLAKDGICILEVGIGQAEDVLKMAPSRYHTDAADDLRCIQRCVVVHKDSP